MEIKVQCGCGTKFKFEVEPVHNRMPYPVSCPACGADGTEQANSLLRTMVQASPEMAAASPTLSQPQPIAPAGLRITKPASAPEPASAPLPPIRLVDPPRKSRGSQLKTVLSTALAVLVIGFGLWKFGTKWYRRVGTAVQVAKAIASGEAGSDESAAKQNFWQEDCVVLFIRHTNEMDVIEVCKDYWKANCKKSLTVAPSEDTIIDEKQYCVVGPHNGYVRLMGNLEWPKDQFEGLAKQLSERFNTLVFETRDVDFSGAYHFGVYEQGIRKFHAQMDVRIRNNEPEETVTTENDDWATSHGFKPGPEGFKEFHLGDGDEISQKMGLKMWDEKEGEKAKVFILTES